MQSTSHLPFLHTSCKAFHAYHSNSCISTPIENWIHVYMYLFTRNSPYYHLLKYLLFLLKHPVYHGSVLYTIYPSLWRLTAILSWTAQLPGNATAAHMQLFCTTCRSGHPKDQKKKTHTKHSVEGYRKRIADYSGLRRRADQGREWENFSKRGHTEIPASWVSCFLWF